MPSQSTSSTSRRRSSKPSARVLPDSIQGEIDAIVPRLGGYSICSLVWNRLLTDAQRRKLGNDFDKALRKEHIVDIWARLHRQIPVRAVVELGYRTELVTTQTYERLLREIGVKKPPRTSARKPVWNRDRCELMLDGEVICRFGGRSRAKNATRILDDFQDLGWPEFIVDPIQGGKNAGRLNQAIYTLNQKQDVIRFHANGSGDGIWREFTNPN